MADTVSGRYGDVRQRLDAACAAAGRRPQDVLLLAVSKMQPASALAELLPLGQLDFGESYAQEALDKRLQLAVLAPGAAPRWHMIGHVQSRKAAMVAGEYALIHSLDSTRLADCLERQLAVRARRQKVLIEVNVGGEAQKTGVIPADLSYLAMHVMERCPHLELEGLMCIPPAADAGPAAAPHFARLRRLREALRSETGLGLPHLSMGMSSDFEVAVAEGATIVRVGTDIFGPRPPRAWA